MCLTIIRPFLAKLAPEGGTERLRINLCLQSRKVGIGLGSSNADWTNRHAELTLEESSSFETG